MTNNKYPLIALTYHRHIAEKYDYDLTPELVEKIRRHAAAVWHVGLERRVIKAINEERIINALTSGSDPEKLDEIIIDVLSNLGPTSTIEHDKWEDAQIL